MPEYPSVYHARIARAMAQYARHVRQRTTPAGDATLAGATDTHTPNDRSTDMIATTETQHTQEVQSMDTITGEGLQILTRLMEQMRTEERWRTPETKMLHAFSAVRDGRVREDYPPGLWHVQGTKKRDGTVPTYTVTDSCTCEDSQTNARSKYCYHMAAVELCQRYRQAQARQTTLFASRPTVEERLAAEPEEHIDFTTDASTDEEHLRPFPTTPEEPPVSTDTMTPSPATQDVTPEMLQKQRGTIRSMLHTLGYKPTSVEEYQGVVLTLTDLILAPDNFAAIIEVLQQLIAAKTKPPGPVIPKEHLTKIQGVNAVKYIGLLHLAREQGLKTLSEEWVENRDDLALARATATFDDGRSFQAIGDATPESGARVKLHWRRLAGTRAKARALRDALGIEAPADEEME